MKTRPISTPTPDALDGAGATFDGHVGPNLAGFACVAGGALLLGNQGQGVVGGDELLGRARFARVRSKGCISIDRDGGFTSQLGCLAWRQSGQFGADLLIEAADLVGGNHEQRQPPTGRLHRCFRTYQQFKTRP